jgi:P27 family predicted phage terminase small subunit
VRKKPPLSLVTDQSSTEPQPPRKLREYGRSLWDRIQSEYSVADSGGLEMLQLACEALDRIAALREQIDRDGEVIRVRGMIKDHPALKHVEAAEAFIVRTLSRMGLNYEAVKPSVGRPGGRFAGWDGVER